jgi:L-lactate dehydrogenase complex protein LldG
MTETNEKPVANGNGGARETILASIRRSLATSESFDAVHRQHHGHSNGGPISLLAAKTGLSQAELIANFRANLESVGGSFTVVTDEVEAAVCVADVIKKLGARRIAVSDSSLVGRIVNDGAADEVTRNAPAEFLFNCDMGITSAQWAIAETGTLVLESERESHRLTSLVPPAHVCVLTAVSIRQTLGEILEVTGQGLSRTMTFITGASRTSDIELTLAIGVHGPAELHVIVILDQ